MTLFVLLGLKLSFSSNVSQFVTGVLVVNKCFVLHLRTFGVDVCSMGLEYLSSISALGLAMIGLSCHSSFGLSSCQ